MESKIWVLKVPKEDFLETDKYGHKAMLKKVNEEYRCPKCGSFLRWKNKRKQLAECPKCDFTKSFADNRS